MLSLHTSASHPCCVLQAVGPWWSPVSRISTLRGPAVGVADSNNRDFSKPHFDHLLLFLQHCRSNFHFKPTLGAKLNTTIGVILGAQTVCTVRR